MQLKPLPRRFFIPSLFLTGGVLIGILLYYLFTVSYVYTHIMLKGLEQNETESITSSLSHKSVFLYSEARVKQLLYERIAGIKDVHIQIVLPNTIDIIVQKKSAFALIKTEGGYFVVAADGEIIQKTTNPPIQLPLISFFQPLRYLDYQRGQKIEFSAIKKALYFITIVESSGHLVDSVAIDSVDMIACKTRTVELIFSQSRSEKQQAHEIIQVLKRLQVGDLNVRRIDLRFNKPVLELRT